MRHTPYRESRQGGLNVPAWWSRVNHWPLWPLALVSFALSAALSQMAGRRASVWFDEGYSITIAQRPVREMLALTAVDTHPPLYYLVLKLWAGATTWDEWALRLLSALCAGAAVALMLVLVRDLAGTRVAYLVAPFTVLAPYHVRFGFEIRMYAMASLIVVAATVVLVRAVRSHKRRYWVAYAVLVALGMYTLYVTAMVWASHVLMFTVRSVVQRRGWRWIWAYVLAVALFVPYAPTAVDQLIHPSLNPFLGQGVTLRALADTLSLLIFGRSGTRFIGTLQSVICLAVVALVAVGFRRIAKDERSQHARNVVGVLLGCAILPFAAFACIDALRESFGATPMFVQRYSSFFSLFSYVLLGFICAMLVEKAWKQRAQAGRISHELNRDTEVGETGATDARHGRSVWSMLCTPRVKAMAAYVCALMVLMIGVVHVSQDGNIDFVNGTAPQSKTIREHVECSPDNTVVAADEFAYIEAQYYYHGCDMRFMEPHEVTSRGGFAPLHGSQAQIRSTRELHTKKVTVLSAASVAKPLQDKRYRQISTQEFGMQRLSVYELRT